MNSTGPMMKRDKDFRDGWRGTVLGLMVATAGAAVIALVVGGFMLAGYLDASGATSIPGINWLARLPAPLRVAIEILVGVPVVFGAALYAITQLLELAWLVSWPLRKLVAAVRGQR